MTPMGQTEYPAYTTQGQTTIDPNAFSVTYRVTGEADFVNPSGSGSTYVFTQTTIGVGNSNGVSFNAQFNLTNGIIPSATFSETIGSANLSMSQTLTGEIDLNIGNTSVGYDPYTNTMKVETVNSTGTTGSGFTWSPAQPPQGAPTTDTYSVPFTIQTGIEAATWLYNEYQSVANSIAPYVPDVEETALRAAEDFELL